MTFNYRPKRPHLNLLDLDLLVALSTYATNALKLQLVILCSAYVYVLNPSAVDWFLLHYIVPFVQVSSQSTLPC